MVARHVGINANEYSDVTIAEFGYENCEKGHDCGPLVRRHWLMHYVVSGHGVYQIGGRTHEVKAGEIFVIPPDVATYYRADEVEPWDYIWVGFSTDSAITDCLSEVIVCPEAEKLFHRMKQCEDYDVGRSLFLAGCVWELFALLLEREGKPQDDYVRRALDCIHSEYMYNLTIADLARRLNLERTYFSVLFRAKMGISPKQYLLNYRMNAAAALMERSDASISVVANSVGYSDLYVFSKMFKRHFGVSPTQYRGERRPR